MTSILAGPGFGGNQTTSRETKSLQDIDLRKHNFVNKDFVRNMAWLNQSVTTLSSYSQLLQKGVDQANQNFLEQIQGFIADLLVMFAGFEPTGVWSFGDLKHVIQGIGALLGINPETPFPLNLAEAAWHLFNSYVVPLPQFTDLIFDAVIVWAETLGLSDEAVDAIQNFDNAVVALYNGIEDSFGNLGVAVKRMLNNLGLGGGWLELGPLNELWDDVKDLVADIIEGPQDLLLNVLSKIVVIDFKAMTWMVNLMNPQNWLAALGLNFLGPQILPEISGDTVDWTVTANANTGWIFDAATSYPNSAGGSFKTNGNGSSKRILTQDTFPCAFGESYAVIGQLKWDSIPAGVDSFGPCIVFYTGAAEIAQINVDAVPGHGATGGWQQVTQSVAVPTDADGFRVGARISAGVNTGTVWIDELSCSKSQSWDEALSSLLLSWTPVKIFQSLLDVFKGGVNGVIADVVDRIQHLLPGSGLFDGGFISGLLQGINIPELDGSIIKSGKVAATYIADLAQNQITNLLTDLGRLLLINIFDRSQEGGSNLVLSPDFEDTTITRIPYATTGFTHGYSTEQKRTGNNSYKWTKTIDGAWAGIELASNQTYKYFTVKEGEAYRASVWLMPHASNVTNVGQVKLYMRWRQSNSSTYTDATTATGHTPSIANSALIAGFQELSNEATCPAGYDRLEVMILSSNDSPNGNSYYVDHAEVREITRSRNIIQAIFGGSSILSKIIGSILPDLDGSIIKSGQVAATYIADLAQTQITGLVTSAGKFVRSLIGINDFENLLSGADFEDDDIPWATGSGKSIATDQYHSGTRSFKFTGAATGAGTYYGPTIAIKEGDRIYAEVWARKDSSYNATDARIRFGSNPGNVNHFNLNIRPADIGSNNTWVKLTATSTAYPAGATSVYPTLTMTGMTAGNLWIDDIVVRRIKPDALLPDLKELRDNIVQAILGGSGTGYLASEVKTHMENVREKSLDWVDGFFNAITGGGSTGVATATAASQAAALADSIVANASAIAQLQAQQSGGFNGGIAGGDDFERVDPTDLDAGGTQWYRYYSGDTSRVLAIEDGHNARLTNTTSDEGATRTWARRQSGAADYQTVTDYQVGTMVFSTTVNSASSFDPASNSIMLRCSADGNHFVEAEVSSGSMTDYANARLYYSTTGIAGRTALSSAVNSITGGNSAGATWTFEAGTSGGLRIFKLKLNGSTKITYTDAGAVTSAGASYRGWGFGQSAPAHGIQFFVGDELPAAITRITIADNMPAPTVGNGFRVNRATTSSVNVTSGKLPNSFLDTVDRISAGWTFTGGSNNGVTVPYTGWYIFELRLYTATDLGIGDEARLVLYNGANECARGRSPVLDATGIGSRNPLFTSVGFHDTFVIYCTAGDIIYPGAYTSITLSCPGNASNNSVYFTGTYVGPQPIVTAS